MFDTIKVGLGIDFHALATGRKLVLGGVDIPSPKGCIAHSDGDIILHALCDALLGAIGLGDIGTHFPDNDPQNKNRNSMDFLMHTYTLVKAQGYSVGNVDVAVCLQSPKIGRFVEQMKKNIAGALNIQVNCVAIKATTTEGLGFIGREEGASAQTIVLLYKR